jgi:CO/xanthine dehydrogenase Mo-binding subunit
LNPSFLEYKVPTALEMPNVNPIIVETNDPEGPFGAKGFSEGCQVPTAPAIVNAICDALGVKVQDLPITPDKILDSLKK